jgi:hypothetical protein
MRVTFNAEIGEGKKTDKGTMMPPLEANGKSNPVTIADPCKAQSLTAATTKDSPNIQIHCRN